MLENHEETWLGGSSSVTATVNFGLFTEKDEITRPEDSFVTYRKTCLLQKFPELIVSNSVYFPTFIDFHRLIIIFKNYFWYDFQFQCILYCLCFLILIKTNKIFKIIFFITFRLYICINSLTFSNTSHIKFFLCFLILFSFWFCSGIIQIVEGTKNASQLLFTKTDDFLFLSEKLAFPSFIFHYGPLMKIFIQLPRKKNNLWDVYVCPALPNAEAKVLSYRLMHDPNHHR